MLRAFLTALGLNAIPAVGWFFGERWSAGTMLVLYWLETLIGTLLVALPDPPASTPPAEQRTLGLSLCAPGERSRRLAASSYLSAFLIPALVFTAAHGFSRGAGLDDDRQEKPEPGNQRSSRTTARRVGRHHDLPGHRFFSSISRVWLRTRSFAWIERLGRQPSGLPRCHRCIHHHDHWRAVAAVIFTGANSAFLRRFPSSS